jgi:ribosome-associated translation inhibitor RaiA
MPSGVMQWFDERTGEGRIVQRGRVFPTSAADRVDERARRVGGRVRFDIERDGGFERATNVEPEAPARSPEAFGRVRERSRAEGEPAMQTVTSGPMRRSVVAYAQEKVAAVAAMAPPPVLFVRIKLNQGTDRAARGAAKAEAVLDLDGNLLRAGAAADSLHEAVDLLVEHLRDRLSHLRHTGAEERAAHNRGRNRRAGFRAVPAEDRRIVRRKAVLGEPMTVEEALFDLDQSGYDFYLFSDLATGKDGFAAYDDRGRATVKFTDTSPVLDDDGAKSWLDATDDPFVFFTGPDGRGRVLYRRVDGHYGLLRV